MAAIYSKLLGIEQKQDQSATLQGETRASVREVRIKLGPGQKNLTLSRSQQVCLTVIFATLFLSRTDSRNL